MKSHQHNQLVQGDESGKQSKAVRLGSRVFFIALFFVVVFSTLYFVVPHLNGATYDVRATKESALQASSTNTTDEKNTKENEKESAPLATLSNKHYIKTPQPLKAIYMTQCVVGTPSFRNDLVKLIDDTELNAVVIDIKDFSGGIAFPVTSPLLQDGISSRCGASDMEAFVASLHEKGIYVIGRITVFQDPLYTKQHPDVAVHSRSTGGVWHDNKGLAFVDVSANPYWDYVVELSRESHMLGFDELNFDYIRFPSDGPMKEALYTWTGSKTKPEALETFFAYLTSHVRDMSAYPTGTPVPVLSADLFGMTTTNTDDLNIGQQLERALPYFDYVAPMIYPSHYPNGFNGWSNPNTVPYELIKFVLDAAVQRTVATQTVVETLDGEKIYSTATSTSGSTTPAAQKVFTGLYTKQAYGKYKIRPWLQDFDYGGNYDVAEVKAQIKATYDAGLDSWMLWAPSNRYTQGALEKN